VKIEPGTRVEVVLKSGAKLQATMVASDDKNMTIQADNGSKITVFRQTVVSITVITAPAKEETKTPEPPPPPAPEQPKTPAVPVVKNEPVPDTAKPAVQAEAPVAKKEPVPEVQVPAKDTVKTFQPEPGARVDVTLKTGARFKATIVAVEAKSLSLVMTTGSKMTVFRQTILDIQKDTSAVAIKVDTAKAVDTVSTAAPVAPPPVPEPVARFKRLNRKGTITLKNGQELNGTLNVEDDLYFSFTTKSGVSLNILKRLVRLVDNKPCVMRSDSTSKAFDTSAQLSKTKAPGLSGKNSGEPDTAARHVLPAVIVRPLPRVSMKTGASMKQLVDSLTSPVAEQRSIALRQLGAMGQWAVNSIPSIVVLLSDPVRTPLLPPPCMDTATVQLLLPPGLEAGRALSRMGTRGYDELAKALKNPDPTVRMRAAFGLGETQTLQAQAILEEALTDKFAEVRAGAAQALHFRESATPLIAALNDADAQVRTHAAATLGEIRSQSATGPLIGLLKDASPLVREQAAAAIGKLGAGAATLPLSTLVSDREISVRKKAIEAIGLIADPAGVPALITALRDTSAAVRTLAAGAIGAVRDSRALLPLLAAALQEKNDGAREQMETALRQLTDIPLLIAALDDRRTAVRENAVQMLWLLTAKEFGLDKLAWLGWLEGEKKSQK
jgi:HEAT repeat protein/small nuclear ribonucleoprotein (snRNP)-like protein